MSRAANCGTIVFLFLYNSKISISFEMLIENYLIFLKRIG